MQPRAWTKRSSPLRRPGWLVLLALLAGCSREPVDPICPPVGPGDLAISELRGPQSGTDTWGQWIEFHNPTGTDLSLQGLAVNLRKLDGTGEVDILVRDPLTVIASGYAVLGRFPSGSLPDHVDYGYEADFGSNLYAGGVVELRACGEAVDRVVYRDLPGLGTLAFDGDLTLTADSNDTEADWCVDAEPGDAGDGGITELGLPGSPGERNRVCG